MYGHACPVFLFLPEMVYFVCSAYPVLHQTPVPQLKSSLLSSSLYRDMQGVFPHRRVYANRKAGCDVLRENGGARAPQYGVHGACCIPPRFAMCTNLPANGIRTVARCTEKVAVTTCSFSSVLRRIVIYRVQVWSPALPLQWLYVQEMTPTSLALLQS